MGVHFVPGGQDALYRHWAAASREIVLACDAAGRIIQATAAAARLGHGQAESLTGQLLWDCLVLSETDWLKPLFEQAIAADRRTGWIEVELDGLPARRRWHELRIDPVLLGNGHLPGAICIMRSIAERRELEREAFAAAMTDQLTGFTNRAAFMVMLDHLARHGTDGCLMIIDLDRFRAINLRHGHTAGDCLLTSFAAMLRRMTGSQHILSRIDGESFAVILPGEDLAAGLRLGESLRLALLEITLDALPAELPFTASVGVVLLEPNCDATLHAAELAVTEAKARGRAQVATCPPRRMRLPWGRRA